MNVEEIPRVLRSMPHVVYQPTGSSYVCDPPVTDTDQDWIVYSRHVKATMKYLIDHGFQYEGHYMEDESQDFGSFRKGKVNIVLTGDITFYRRYRAATELARRFNLRSKADRIALFDVVVKGLDGPEDEEYWAQPDA